MRVTTWAEYGIIVSLHLARRVGDGPVAARDIAEQENLPADYVEQILLRLRRFGLVDSERGARGGYSLAHSPEDITVKDVVDASELGTFEVNCVKHPLTRKKGLRGRERSVLPRCLPGVSCSMRPVWQLLQKHVDDTLGRIRLGDLLHEEAVVRDMIGRSTAAV